MSFSRNTKLPNKVHSCSNLVFWHHEFDNRFNLFHNNTVKKRENPKNSGLISVV